MSNGLKWGMALVVIIVGAAVGKFGLNASTGTALKMETKRAVLVSVARTQVVDLPVRYSVQGHLVALNQVDVRPQLSGTIRSVHFHEGDEVRQGQLLFVLDARDATAQLHRAQAQMAQFQVQLDNEQRNQRRVTTLVKSGYVSSSDVDAISSKVDTLKAQLQAARADVESAQVQVARSRIVAPVSGRAGAVTVHPGSLAQQGESAALVNVMQLDPIGVEFSLPERALGGLLRAKHAGAVGVSVVDADEKLVRGELSFINNTVNTATGTISLKGKFSNARQRLWPGAFVRVQLDAGVDKSVVVLPPQAVMEGPDGHFVYQVDTNGEASMRPVTLLRIQDQYAVIEGMSGGENVVVEGALGLIAGAKVHVMEPAATAVVHTELPATKAKP